MEIIENEEGPALGAAILAAVGCGAYESIKAASDRIVKVIDTVEPDDILVCRYEQKYEQFKKIYPALKCLY